MDDINGVLWDGTFYYKDLSNAVKLSWQQFNHNLETIKNISDNIGGQLDVATQSAAAALASQQAAALSATEAFNAKTASEAAKDLSEEANTLAQAAKNTAVSAKDTAVSANTTAQGAKTAAELARNDSVAARNIAQTSATTATNAKNAAETARNTATQKATEASSSATAAAQSAAEAKESASAVTSVQGKQGVVSLIRADFSWMGDAAEKNASFFMKSAGRQNLTVSEVTWPNAVNNDPNNWITNSLFQWQANNSSITLIGDSTTNARRFGFQVGHASSEYASSTGRMDLNPLGGGVFINGSEAHDKGNLPQATQAEIDVGTQTAPRLFSPKQLHDSHPKVFKNKITITESQTIQRPTDGPMFMILYGPGGRGASSSAPAYLAGGAGGVLIIDIPSGSLLPETLDIEIGSHLVDEFLQSGTTSFLGFEAKGGYGGSGSVGSRGLGGTTVSNFYSINPFRVVGLNGKNGTSVDSYANNISWPKFPDPKLFGKGGPKMGEPEDRYGKPGIAVIYY